MEELHKLYPEAFSDILPSTKVLQGINTNKKVAYFCEALKCVRNSWSNKWTKTGQIDFEHLVLATFGLLIKAASELFDLTEEETAVSIKSATAPPPLPAKPRKAAVPAITATPPPPPPPPPPAKVTPPKVTVPSLTAPPPPPPPPPATKTPSKVAVPSTAAAPPPPPPAIMPSKDAVTSTKTLKTVLGPPPPPPSIGAGKSSLQKKPTSKLKRSTKMPNLYQQLKKKMDESSIAVKSRNKKQVQLGGSSGGQKGLGDSIAELTKRSPYLQQIEEDVEKYRKQILNLILAINSFQTNDKVNLLKFQNNVESILGVLTDESQVLARFEDFPTKKLETLRTATALYSKFDTMITTLKSWVIERPLRQLQLDKIESYFAKIKLELEAFDRTKDEQSKMFKSHNIEFDFHLITRIKESMIDLSSSCMELALQVVKETKTAEGNRETLPVTSKQKEEIKKMLWRVFQLAFRVYSFAGGQDDRADKLSKELADEILVESQNQ